jgi:hypothetical protein
MFACVYPKSNTSRLGCQTAFGSALFGISI